MAKTKILYVELKSGYNDNGPAWICKCEYSKSGRTLYCNDKALQASVGPGISSSNYYDVETGEEYWISGLKKNQQDRHWAGSGKIKIDKNIVDDYLEIVGKTSLKHSKYEIYEQKNGNVKERVNKILNEKLYN